MMTIGNICYFDNPEKWGFSTYKYVMDCILLPGDYWRPIWSIFNRLEAVYCPMSMPYANHIFISLGMVGIAYELHLLCLKLQVKKIVAITISMLLILATTSMGALLSVDSLQNVCATFFGLMSVQAYVNNKGWKRYMLWFASGWLAAMGKETGFVWFLAGPIMDEILQQKDNGLTFNFSNVRYKQFLTKILIALLPMVLYLGLYVSFKPSLMDSVGMTSDEQTTTAQVEKKDSKSMFTTMTEMEEHNSYKLSPSTLVKNIAILYMFGIVPIDTSAIYFKEYALLGITGILSLIWLLCLFRPIKQCSIKHGQEICGLLLLAFWISGPSLVTRAGEISPIVHMSIIAVAFAVVFNEVKWTKMMIIGVFCFLTATVITDIHKYSIAYRAGDITRKIAKETVNATKGKPEKVLMVQVDDFMTKKSGAFMINPADGIRKGSAMIREYNYKYPHELKYILIPNDETINEKVDSLVNVAKGHYDCVWFLHDTKSKVYNLK